MSYVKGEESDFFSNNFDESSLSFTEFMVIRSRKVRIIQALHGITSR